MPRGFFLLIVGICCCALADLRVFSSRYYQIHTDLEPGIAQDLARRLDVMHEEYERRLLRFSSTTQRPRVDAYLFARREDYLQFAGASMRSTGGVFIPSRNALAACYDEQGRDSLRRTLQHEAFHQFAANSIPYPLPMWLNEGMAQYFEEGFWTGYGFVLGQAPPRRVRQLQWDIRAGRLTDFAQFMTMAPDQWAESLGTRYLTRGATQYNQAWAMVHFLINASDASGQPRFRPRFIQMIELISKGEDPQAAFNLSFSGNLAGFRDRFNEWAANLEPSVEATYIERQEVLADMLVAMHDHNRTFADMRQFRETVERTRLRIDYSRGQIRWSSEPNGAIYFSRMDGSPFSDDELYFQARRGSPLPDIVCKALPNTALRTRFYRLGKQIRHELLLEPLTQPPALASPLSR